MSNMICVPIATEHGHGAEELAAFARGEEDAHNHEVRCVPDVCEKTCSENRRTRRETRRDAREDDIAVTDDGIKYVTFGFVLSAAQRVQAREEEAKLQPSRTDF